MVADYAPDKESFELERAVELLVVDRGFRIVELKTKTVKGQTHVHLVLDGPRGVTIDDIADVHRAVQPVIESTQAPRDVNIEVSTPGIDRVFKTTREFSVFQGRGVRVLRHSDQKWVSGIIDSTDESSVTIRSSEGSARIAFAEVVKAKLDYTQEEEH